MSKESRKSFFFRNCDKPTLSPVTGIVKGIVPTWLNGTLTRNGPGIQKVGKYTYKHMFDGLAVLHRFHIENGTVTYNNKPLESDVYRKNMAAERIVVGEFGTVGYGDPCDTLFNKFKTIFVSNEKKDGETEVPPTTDNCSVNVAYYGDQLYAMTETQLVRRIDPATLNTIGGKTDLSDYLAINGASAHPHVLPDGTVLNLGINYRHKKGCCYVIIQVPPSFGSTETSFKDAKIIAEIPARWRLYSGYYHSFGITKDKIVFIEQPFCFSIPRFLMNTIKETSFVGAHQWYPNEKTRIHVVSMVSGEIHPVIYETDNLFVFHHANTYEENGSIIMDVTGYDSGAEVKTHLNHDTILSKPDRNSNASARRYVLPLDISNAKKGSNLVSSIDTKATAVLRKGSKNIVDLKPEIQHDEWFEFPRINYKYNGDKYRYIYGGKSTTPREMATVPEPNMLTRLDTQTLDTLSWVGKNVWVSEPVFVPNPTVEDPQEDDGVILSNLLHADDELKTTLLVLDGKTMKELASVEFRTDGPVTSTFHGQWATTGEKVHLY